VAIIQQNSVSVRLGLRISDGAMIVPDIPSVQLKDQLVVHHQSFVLRTAMRALAAKQSMIPTTACLNITHAN